MELPREPVPEAGVHAPARGERRDRPNAAKQLECLSVEAQVVPKMVSLEDGVVPYHEHIRLRHEWLQDQRCEFRMSIRRQQIPDVVQQTTHDVFLVSPVAMGSGRHLETMRESVDR